jgi:hypothetical protein
MTRDELPTHADLIKPKGATKRVTTKPKAAPKAKPSANGHAGAALDLAALKGGSKIVGTFKGRKHEATIIADGVLYRGKTYKSLSAAARAVIVATDGESSGSRVNGRTFWRSA